jgi:hypothetical protein
MSTHVTVAVGPNGDDDYKKLITDANGSLVTNSNIQPLAASGKITIVSLSSSSWTALPSTALNGRKSVSIQNQSDNGNIVLINFSSSAPGTDGFRIDDGGTRSFMVGGSLVVYGRMKSGSGSVAVEEIA